MYPSAKSHHSCGERGATVVEAAIALGIFIISSFIAIDIVIAHMRWITVQRAVSEAHREMALDPTVRNVPALTALVRNKAANYGLYLEPSLTTVKICEIDPKLVTDLRSYMSTCVTGFGNANSFTALDVGLDIKIFSTANVTIHGRSVKQNERSFVY